MRPVRRSSRPGVTAMAAAALGLLLLCLAGAPGRPLPARAQQQPCVLVLGCSPQQQPPAAPPPPTAPPPEQFVLPPPASTAPPATPPVITPPPASAAVPTPPPTLPPVVAVPVTPTPSPTPITVGGDRQVSVHTVQPESTGSEVDGGSLLLRLFLLLAVLAVGSVAGLVALR